MQKVGNAVAINVPGGNRIRRIHIKAQRSAFSRAINKTVSKSIYIFIRSDVFSKHKTSSDKIEDTLACNN